MDLKRLDKVFSSYIRLRDSDDNGIVRCFCCGKVDHYKTMDCSHFVNRKHLSLRFNEINCQTTCRACNRFDEGNLPAFAINLQNKFGNDIIQKLLISKNNYTKLSQFDIDTLEKYYKMKIKELLLNKGLKP